MTFRASVYQSADSKGDSKYAPMQPNRSAVESSAFARRFLSTGISAFEDDEPWLWTPLRPLDADSIKTATFSGKNRADDWTRDETGSGD